ncbi:MAG: DinB family protein [Dehalococcoidia bacterium]|nr:MAG: DinB family protein [Dehalococcoidia bacterium]
MNDQAPAEETAGSQCREAIRAEVQTTRAAYHELLRSLSPDDWNKKSANPAWSVGQLMWHVAWGDSYALRGVADCKRGRGFNPPQFITNTVNMLITRWGARRATPQSVAEKYDAAHTAILAALDEVQDDEWDKGAKMFGEFETVESVLRSPVSHFKEHKADILKGLGRG